VVGNDPKTGQMGLNGKLFGKIVFWWLITVPVALGVSYSIEKIILAA